MHQMNNDLDNWKVIIIEENLMLLVSISLLHAREWIHVRRW